MEKIRTVRLGNTAGLFEPGWAWTQPAAMASAITTFEYIIDCSPFLNCSQFFRLETRSSNSIELLSPSFAILGTTTTIYASSRLLFRSLFDFRFAG